MATEIGIIKMLIGTAVAISADGSQHSLHVGDKLFADEIVSTGALGAVEIEFNDGSVMDLGRNSQAMLDNDVFDPQHTSQVQADVQDSVDALQQAILAGDDPTQGDNVPATAAGAGAPTGNEGSTTVTVDYLAPVAPVTSGFDTTGPTVVFPNLVEVTQTPLVQAVQAVDSNVITDEDNALLIDVQLDATITSFSAPANGVAVLNNDGTITYTPSPNFSGNDNFTYTVTDTNGNISSATINVAVNAVADVPNLLMSVDDSTVFVPASTGINMETYTNFYGNQVIASKNLISLTDAKSPTNSAILANQDVFRTGTDNSDANNTLPVDVASVAKGLIFLEAGQHVSFSGYSDDSLLITLGGKILLSTTGDSWGNYDTSIDQTDVPRTRDSNGDGVLEPSGGRITTAGDYIVGKSGYYTLGTYIYNHGGPGDMAINVTINGVTTALNSQDLQLYPNITSVDSYNGEHLGFISGPDISDGGYYPLPHHYSLDISAALTDVDGSEVLSDVIIAGDTVVGMTLVDASGNTLVADANGNYVIDVTTNNSATSGSETITLVSSVALTPTQINAISGSVSATEMSNNDSATTTVTAKVSFSGLDATGETADLLISGDATDNTVLGGSGNDIIFGGAGNDTLSGSTGADEFIWNKIDVGAGSHDTLLDFNASQGDTLNLSDLLSDGSHSIEGINIAGHLQVNINDSSGATVQSIELNSLAITTDANATLQNLLDTGAINDGI